MFKIKANPTFKVPVEIARSDGEAGTVTFEFRHKTTDAANDFLQRAESLKPTEWAKEIVVGWDGVEVAYSEDALSQVLQEHFAAAEAILKGYLRGLSGGKLGN